MGSRLTNMLCQSPIMESPGTAWPTILSHVPGTFFWVWYTIGEPEKGWKAMEPNRATKLMEQGYV
jgi:hypothetical protein